MLKKTCLTAAIAIGVLCAVMAMAQATGLAQQQAASKWFTCEHLYGGAPPPAAGAPQEEITVPLPVITGWLDEEHCLETRTDPADKRPKTLSVSLADGKLPQSPGSK